MPKTFLAVAWGGLHLLAGVGLAVAADRLATAVGIVGTARVLVVAGVVVAWLAVGVLGLLVLLSARDLVRLARRRRASLDAVSGAVDDLSRDRAELVERHAELRHVQADLDQRVASLDQRVEGLDGRVADEVAAARTRGDGHAAAVADLDRRVTSLGTGLEQAARDDARGHLGLARRLDDVADRLAAEHRSRRGS